MRGTRARLEKYDELKRHIKFGSSHRTQGGFVLVFLRKNSRHVPAEILTVINPAERLDGWKMPPYSCS
jgi:hypothetical protein